MAQSKNSVFSYQSWVHAVAGATGGVVAMSVFYPLDTVRARLQLEDSQIKKDSNTIEILKQLIREEGFTTLYRGLMPVLESLCISNFVYFYTFHGLKSYFDSGDKQNALKDLLIGAVSGAINVMTTTPFWVVNTRLKMKGLKGDKPTNSEHYENLLSGLFYIAKTEGIPGLWAGAIPSLILVINPALQFMMYEMIKRKLVKSYGELSALTYFGIGAVSKAFATVLTYPLQLVQTKLRHGSKDTNMNIPRNAGILKMLLYIVKTQGINGLFRGLEAKLLQTVLTAALLFATYEKIASYVVLILTSSKRRRH